jgi:hypothetical protein
MPANQNMNELISNLGPLENKSDGLTSLLDGTIRAECGKLLSNMEQKPIPKKMKIVSFAGEKMMNRIHIASTNSPSPTRYRTRATFRQEISSTSNNEFFTYETPATMKFVLNTQVPPQRSPWNHPSPTDSEKQRLPRSPKLSLQATNVKNIEGSDIEHNQTAYKQPDN